MKKIVGFLLVAFISSICFYSLGQKVDIEKEKEAIKAVFEQEKNAFLKQDIIGMGDTWVKDPISTKIYMYSTGISKILGWEKINGTSLKEISDTTYDRKQLKINILNYQIDVMDKSAWVLCDYHMEGIVKGVATVIDQTRICVLKKVDGKWKFALMSMYNIPPKKTN